MSRETFTGASAASVAPDVFLDQYSGHIGTLYNAANFRLTEVSGVDDITATLAPDFDAGGLVDGMKFSFLCAGANTGPVRLGINGEPLFDVLDAAGVALPPGALSAGLLVQTEFRGGAFRITSPGGVDAGAVYAHWVFEESDTWTPPDGLPDDRLVLVEAWGGGGGGSSDSGGSRAAGGGAAYMRGLFRAVLLPSSISITVGAGGALNTVGGDTTFGSLLTAYGGGRGASSQGGGGAGSHEPGGIISAGAIGGGDGAADDFFGFDATTIWGGGGGSRASGDANGGRAVYGGGGGASGSGSGGQSIYGGNGGNPGQAGQVPGGGGGSQAPGARGECRITLI